MHKRIRIVENIAHMAEHKFARQNFFDLYCANKSQAVKLAHEHFKMEFKNQLGIKYFIPDPQNGGNRDESKYVRYVVCLDPVKIILY